MLWPLLVIAATLAAQDPAPVGIVRGEFLGWKGQPAAGQFSILTNDRHIFQFVFDHLTYFERLTEPIRIGQVRTGDRIEIVCDRGPSPTVGYARSVQVLVRQPIPRGHIDWPKGDPTEEIVPAAPWPWRLAVPNQPHPTGPASPQRREKSVILRTDTVYLEYGLEVDLAHLKVNTPCSLSAAPTLTTNWKPTA